MSLTTAFQIAQSGLAVTAAQSGVVSGNIAGLNDPDYVRRVANVVTDGTGMAVVGSISRMSDSSLLDKLLSTTAASRAASALADGLDQLATSVGDTSSGQSPAALLGTMANALQSYISAPDNQAQGQEVVNDAKALAGALNGAASLVQSVRQSADNSIALAVTSINADLARFEQVNTAIIAGTASGGNVNDALNTRDALLKDLSQYMGISTSQQANGGMAIYTDSGVTLFETRPRTVAFAATSSLPAGTNGNAVTVDGVPVTGASSTMPLGSGSIAGLAKLRDTIAPTYQSQLDSIANGLISAFSETDTSGSGLPAQAGMFSWSGGPTLPSSATGLAASIKVSASVDPMQGGNVTLLRDGGIAGSAYNSNSTGLAGYTAHLQALADTLSATRSFSAAGQIGTSMNLAGYAGASAGWIEAQRQSASTQTTYQTTLQTSTAQALSNASGVNIDTEMTKMLSLENSYQASAKLLSTINAMFDSLMQVTA